MTKDLFIKRFEIEELFGIYNVNIPFKDNINIFVGENGLGKTTILNALNYVIQGDSESLAAIEFKKMILTLGNDAKIVIIHDDLMNNNISIRDRNRLYHYLPNDDYSYITQRIMLEILKEKTPNMLDDKITREKIYDRIVRKYRYDLPPSILEKIYNSVLKDKNFEKELKDSWEYKIYDYMKKWDRIIYLPTYRRIEEDFNSYIENSPDKDYYRKDKKKRNFSYLQFGMDDVQESIDMACSMLKNNTNEGFKAMTSNLLTNYVNINEKNEKLDFNYKNFDASTLDIVFSRLADKIDPSVKNKITDMLDENTVLGDKYHQYLISIISELTSIYEKNKQIDDNLENFKNVCNTYLVNKSINYDKFKIECKVEQNNTKQPIILKNLSSGEKQIISLFSKLYLNLEEKNIILFDEPELSLSILWQKRLVPDIINSSRCSFMAIITHSPFIFDNDFREMAIDIKEYISSVK
jgi:predicted ATPase